MTVAVSGMSLHTNNDNEAGWSGTDGPDAYFVAVQGSNSESWLVSKNNSETGTLTKSADLSGTDKLFNMWMKSDLSYYYTSIKVRLISSAGNYREYTLATTANPKVSGDFHAFTLDVNDGGVQTGTFVPASLTSLAVIVDNSSSGNIRSVTNNWIDAMYFGPGLTISGTTVGDQVFTEATVIDEAIGNRYGVLENIDEKIFSQGNLHLTGTALTSKNESLTFRDTDNGLPLYKLTVSGTIVFDTTLVDASGAAAFLFSSVGASSFSMTGGGFTKASAVNFDSGQNISGINVIGSGAVDTKGAAFSNSTIAGTAETATGSLVLNSASEASNISNIQFKNFTGRYAVYVPASVSGSIALNGFISDGSGTDIYWVGTGGTLTVNMAGGTNFTTTASAGGTVLLENTVALTIDAPVSLAGAEIRIYDLDNTPAGSLGTELAGTESHGSATYLYTGSGGNLIWIQIMLNGYVEFGQAYTMPTSDGTFTALLKADLNT